MTSNSTITLVHAENGGPPPTPKEVPRRPHGRNVAHPTTDLETLVHLLKGSLGSGILAMPLAFLHGGLFFGLVATIIVGFISTYCINTLVKCAQYLCQRRKLPSLSFDAIAEVGFQEGPVSLRKFSGLAKFMVNFFLVTDLLGCCCVYIVFVCSNLKQVIDLYLESGIDLRVYMLCCLPPLILMNLIRNLKYLAPLSMIANIFLGLGIGITVFYVFQDLPPVTSRPAFSSLRQLPLFFGTVIFALEGIGVVMPLENNMKTPEHFIGCPGVLNIGMSIVVFLYCFLGFLGYLRYGPDTKGSISLNLPDELLAQSVKVMIAIAMFFTYALQFYVPMEIIWRGIKHKFPQHPLMAEYTLRILIVCGSVVVAILVPNLGPFISLVGAVCLSFLGLIFPSVLELVVFWNETNSLGCGLWVLWKNILMISFGIVGFLTGTYSSLLEIYESYGTNT